MKTVAIMTAAVLLGSALASCNNPSSYGSRARISAAEAEAYNKRSAAPGDVTTSATNAVTLVVAETSKCVVYEVRTNDRVYVIAEGRYRTTVCSVSSYEPRQLENSDAL